MARSEVISLVARRHSHKFWQILMQNLRRVRKKVVDVLGDGLPEQVLLLQGRAPLHFQADRLHWRTSSDWRLTSDYCESAAAAADENDRPARRAGKGVTWLRSSTNRSARVRHFLAWAPYTVAGRPDISRFNDRTWFWLKFGLRIAAITFSVKNASVLWLISFVVTHIWDFLPQSLHCNNFPGIS